MAGRSGTSYGRFGAVRPRWRESLTAAAKLRLTVRPLDEAKPISAILCRQVLFAV